MLAQTEVQQISIAIFESPDDVYRNMQCISDVKNIFKIKKNVNYKILKQIFLRDAEE
jgi:hypothetical protein